MGSSFPSWGYAYSTTASRRVQSRIVPEHAEPSLPSAASNEERPREGFDVKLILAAAMVLTLGVTGILLWEAAHARSMAVSSSQIFVHGMPVCVVQQAGEIIASVGMCGGSGSESGEYDVGNRGLPPGHPPVDALPVIEEGRRILI
jgi:hypothetical protein